MSKYIDVEWLKQNFNTVFWSQITKTIDSAPSIDIVRCGECKHWRAYETWSECERWTDDPYESATTKADDFCSYGEREGECIECHYEPKDEQPERSDNADR